MDSLVLELQKAADDENIKVSALLRKAKMVAVKLKRTDIDEWIQKETSGYIGEVSDLEYRKVPATVKAWNSYSGKWMPVHFNNANVERILSRINLGSSVEELESILKQMQEDSSATIRIEVSRAAWEPLFAKNWEFQQGITPSFHISQQPVVGILAAVRNKILDWSLELEAQGILGEGMTFSTEDVSKATKVTFIISNSNVTGIGGINASITTTDDHSTSSTIEIDNHSITSNVNINDYSQIYLELKEKGVPDDAIKELKESIDLLQKGDSKDKKSALKKGMAFIKKHGPTIGTLAILIKAIFAE